MKRYRREGGWSEEWSVCVCVCGVCVNEERGGDIREEKREILMSEKHLEREGDGPKGVASRKRERQRASEAGLMRFDDLI